MPRPRELITIADGSSALTIDVDRGARAVSWVVEGCELLGERSKDPVEYGMYPMAPWAGRLRGNCVGEDEVCVALPVTYGEWALHGTVLDRPGDIVGQSATSLRVRFEEHGAWPWPARVDVSWQIAADAVITEIAVHALDRPFPAVVGWHPWFRRSLASGDPLRWSIDATSRLERGADFLPTGEHLPYRPEDGPFDDAFEVPSGRGRVEWPGALTIDIHSNATHYVVYDEVADLVCVEPQSGPPDGLHDAALVQPGVPLVLQTSWRLSPDARPADRG